jgi:hypothetical protein
MYHNFKVEFLRQHGFLIERKPRWMRFSSLEKAKKYDILSRPELLDNVEPGVVRIYGAFAKVAEYRDLIQELLDSPIASKFFKGRARLSVSVMRAPAIGFGRQRPHRDSSSVTQRFDPLELLVLIYLDSATKFSGATSLVPRSHIRKNNNKRAHITPTMQSGDVLWMNPTLIHKGQKNIRRIYRRILLVTISDIVVSKRREDGDIDPRIISNLDESLRRRILQ